MNLPPLLTKTCYPVFCFFLCLSSATAQDKQAAVQAGFPNELGLDFAPFVRGQPGLSLLYKRKIGRIKSVKWQKQSALRLVAGFYKEGIDSYDLPYHRGDTTFVSHGASSDAHRSSVSLGFERQLDRRKFRFYYGGEAGYRGTRSRPENRTEATLNGTTFPYDFTQSKLAADGAELIAFSGANYFFLPHFSVGLELHFSYGLEFTTIHTFRNDQLIRTYQNTIFTGASELLHLLYLGYHF